MVKRFTNIFADQFRAVPDAPVEEIWSVGSSALPSRLSRGDFDPGRTYASRAQAAYNT
jgi:hypothetical protein